jgi:hypothetical protein
LEKAELVEKVMMEQSELQGSIFVIFLYHEGSIGLSALLVAIVLNCMYIWEVAPDHVAWTVFGLMHLFLSIVVSISYVINHFTIDNTEYQARIAQGKRAWNHQAARGHVTERWRKMMEWVENLGLFCSYWCFGTKLIYVLVAVVFSCLGNFSVHVPDNGMKYAHADWALGNEHWFFVFGILEICNKISAVRLIIDAVGSSIAKLISTISLAFLLLYVFAVIGQRFFRGEYSFPDTDTSCAPSQPDSLLFEARCAFSDRNLHSRMPLDPTHVRLKRTRV